MASNIYVYLPAGSPTNYYLSGRSRLPYSGSGTPWTSQATTPYSIAMNDVIGHWEPQSAQAQLIMSGGLHFIAPGSPRPLYKAYPNITEPIPIQIYASTYDNAVFLKQQLWKLLNNYFGGPPCVLALQPNGSTNTGYTEIYSADIQENGRFINEEAGLGILRCTVTVVRRPFWGVISNGETSLQSQTFTNTGATSGDTVAYGASPSGDLVIEGQPTTIGFIPAQNTAVVFLASVIANTYSTTGAAALSTSSTTGTATALNAPTLNSTTYNSDRIKLRSLMRFSNNTSNVQIRVEVKNTASGTVFYAGPWLTPTNTGGTTLMDMGHIPIDAIRRTNTQGTLQLYIGYRSTNGASATTTLTHNELLEYYEFCRVDTSLVAAGNPTTLNVRSFFADTSRPVLPLPTATAYSATNSTLYDVAVLRGTPPMLHSGAKLYCAWMRPSYVHTTTDTASVTVSHAPLWTSFRGGD